MVSALEDPDLRVAGRGHARLRAAGIEVVEGVLGEAALRANLGHVLRVTQGRPMVTLKLAETRDGFAAGDDHDARLMITGALANERTFVERAEHDAIMVGIGTVLADDPVMTVRLPGYEQHKPLRVVLDTHLRLPLASRLVASAEKYPTVALAGQGASAAREEALLAHGIAVWRVPEAGDGHIDLLAAQHLLARKGLTRIFSEGGPKIAAALIGQGLADACLLFTSHKPLGRPGVEALVPAARKRLKDAASYQLVTDQPLGQDRMRLYQRILP